MKPRLIFLLISMALLFIAGAFSYTWLFTDLPDLSALPQHLNQPSVRIVDRNGRTLYEVLPEQGGRHAVVSLSKIPLACQQATIATEDRSFYQNPGVDLIGILRAAWINARGGDVLVGGSTITQQVARNLLLGEDERFERSYRRKLREAFLAWRLTNQYSKDEILLFYLNQTYYGGMAYGLEAAAQTFFGESVSDLDLAQCAMLAGLPQAPAVYNPFSDLEAAEARQRVVLELMQEDGYISEEQLALAERERLLLAETPYPIEAPHFVMMVRAQLDELFSQEEVYQHGGLVVRTTLDLDWQKHAERAVARHLEALQTSEDGLGHNVNNAALVALDPETGEVLALVGGPDYFDSEHGGAINMALAPRQPGSALKPLVYAAAFDPARPGHPWTAATMIFDVRTAFVTKEGEAYIPENYDLVEHGPVLVREALASSLNIPAVITLDHIGLADLFDLAQRLGITTLRDPDAYDLSLALGGGEVRLLGLTAAYGAFASGGFRVVPAFILEVSNFQGETLFVSPPPIRQRVLDARVAWLITDILSDDDARRIGFGSNSVLRLDRPAAVKTGTTSNFHDNWTVGYTPDLVVGVWTGNTSYEPMRGVNGLSGAAPIWHQFMRTVLSNFAEKEFLQPPGLVSVEVCALSGMLPTKACPYRVSEWFIEGTQPVQDDGFYRDVVIDSQTGNLASVSTPSERRVARVVLDLPPQAHPWARAQGFTLYSDLLAADVGQIASLGDSPLRLIHPASGSQFIISTVMSSAFQRIRLEAVAQTGVREVTIYVDGEEVARFANAPYLTWWELTPGEHQVWAEGILPDGKRVVSMVIVFTVR